MIKPIEVKALENYHLFIKYENGVSGKVDLSDLIMKGIFSVLQDHREFQKVYIGQYGQIAWNNDLELCSDSLYMKITEKINSKSIFRSLNEEPEASS